MLLSKQIPMLPDGVHCDGAGLYLRVRGNSRTWSVRYQVKGKRHEAGIGAYPAVGLSAARQKAAALKARIAAGEDVIAKKIAKACPVFASVAEDAIKSRTTTLRLRESTVTSMTQPMRDYVLPVIGQVPVDEVSRSDVLRVVSPLFGRSMRLADKARWLIEITLDYAASFELRNQENPARRKTLSAFFPPMNVCSQIEHHAAPEFETLRGTIIPALASRGYTGSAVVLLCAYTALRVGEVTAAQWDWISEDGMTMTVPREVMKCGRFRESGFRVPLSAQARELLRTFGDRSSGYIFPGRFGGRFGKNTALLEMRKASGDRLTVHGLRSTFRDWCAREGVDYTVAEMCLSHTPGSTTVRAYFRDDLLDQRREVLQRWCDAITAGRLGRSRDADGGEGKL